MGCGPRSDRLEVAGTVTLDGAPLDGGSIRLTSVGGEKLMAAGAMIQKGEYLIPQEKGLLARHVPCRDQRARRRCAADYGARDARRARHSRRARPHSP